MANPKKQKGDVGEACAAALMEQKGYTIIARNFRTRFGEIDLIAQNERFLLFVEVKARKANTLVSAAEAVDVHKQSRLRLAAEEYLAQQPTALQPRFDVICLTLAPQPALQCWIEDAF